MVNPIYDLTCPCFNSLHSLWIVFTGYVFVYMIMVLANPTNVLASPAVITITEMCITRTGHFLERMVGSVFFLPVPRADPLYEGWLALCRFCRYDNEASVLWGVNHKASARLDQLCACACACACVYVCVCACVCVCVCVCASCLLPDATCDTQAHRWWR